jgi:hypothetical protein
MALGREESLPDLTSGINGPFGQLILIFNRTGTTTGEACLTVRIKGAVCRRPTPGSAPTLSVSNAYSSSCKRQTAHAARLARPVVAIA